MTARIVLICLAIALLSLSSFLLFYSMRAQAKGAISNHQHVTVLFLQVYSDRASQNNNCLYIVPLMFCVPVCTLPRPPSVCPLPQFNSTRSNLQPSYYYALFFGTYNYNLLHLLNSY